MRRAVLGMNFSLFNICPVWHKVFVQKHETCANSCLYVRIMDLDQYFGKMMPNLRLSPINLDQQLFIKNNKMYFYDQPLCAPLIFVIYLTQPDSE